MESTQYVFCYQENQPSTLVMLKKPQTIISQMFDITQSAYIWISQDSQLHSKIFLQVYDELQINLAHFTDFQRAIEMIKKSTKKVIIICSRSYSIKIKDELIYIKKFPNVQKILNFTYIYQNHRSYEVKDIQQIHGNVELIKKLKEQKDKGFVYKKLPNFISLKDQVWSSNMLMPTIFTMINQRTNQQQIILELQKLIKESPNLKKNDIASKKQFLYFMKGSLLSRRQIISWYTKQTFLYGLINNLLRSSRHPAQIFFIQPYFKCLFDTIKEIYHEQIKNKNIDSFVCYRGGVINQEEFLYYQNNIGAYIQNLGFLSASLKKDIPITKDYTSNIYFTIKVDHQLKDPVLNFGYAFLEKYSSFPEEQQILFNPLNTFKIIDITQQVQVQASIVMKKITLKHISMEQNRKDKYEDYEQIRKIQIKLLGNYRIQGHLLINNQLNIKGGISYWQKFLQLSTKPQQRAQAYRIMSFSQYFNHNYINALKNIEQAQSIIQEEYGCNSLQYASILNSKAQVMQKLLLYEKSQMIFKQSLTISRKFQSQWGQSNSLYFQTLSNMSYLLIQSGKYAQFLKLFNNIREISQIDKNNDKFIVLKLYFNNNYGIFLTKINQYSSALLCFLQNLAYFRTFLGDTHPYYFVTLHNIAKTHYNNGDLHQALASFAACMQYLNKTQKQNEKTINHGFYYYIMGKISKQLGIHKEYEVYFEKSIQIYRQNYLQNRQFGAQIPYLYILNQYRKYSNDQSRQMLEVEISSILEKMITRNMSQFKDLSNCRQVRLLQISQLPEPLYSGSQKIILQKEKNRKQSKQILCRLEKYQEDIEDAKKQYICNLEYDIRKMEQNICQSQQMKIKMQQISLALFYVLQKQVIEENIAKIVSILLRIGEYYMKIGAKTSGSETWNKILSLTKILYKSKKQQYKILEKYIQQKYFLYCQYENDYFLTSLSYF